MDAGLHGRFRPRVAQRERRPKPLEPTVAGMEGRDGQHSVGGRPVAGQGVERDDGLRAVGEPAEVVGNALAVVRVHPWTCVSSAG